MLLSGKIRYLVADYAKFINSVTELRLEFIGKLRHDASLR